MVQAVCPCCSGIHRDFVESEVLLDDTSDCCMEIAAFYRSTYGDL